MTDESSAKPSSRHQLFEAAREEVEWTVEQLWIHYLALGGTFAYFDLDAYLAGLTSLPAPQQDVLACALNEGLADLHQPARLPYLTALTTWPGEVTLAELLEQPPPEPGPASQ